MLHLRFNTTPSRTTMLKRLFRSYKITLLSGLQNRHIWLSVSQRKLSFGLHETVPNMILQNKYIYKKKGLEKSNIVTTFYFAVRHGCLGMHTLKIQGWVWIVTQIWLKTALG